MRFSLRKPHDVDRRHGSRQEIRGSAVERSAVSRSLTSHPDHKPLNPFGDSDPNGSERFRVRCRLRSLQTLGPIADVVYQGMIFSRVAQGSSRHLLKPTRSFYAFRGRPLECFVVGHDFGRTAPDEKKTGVQPLGLEMGCSHTRISCLAKPLPLPQPRKSRFQGLLESYL